MLLVICTSSILRNTWYATIYGDPSFGLLDDARHAKLNKNVEYALIAVFACELPCLSQASVWDSHAVVAPLIHGFIPANGPGAVHGTATDRSLASAAPRPRLLKPSACGSCPDVSIPPVHHDLLILGNYPYTAPSLENIFRCFQTNRSRLYTFLRVRIRAFRAYEESNTSTVI